MDGTLWLFGCSRSPPPHPPTHPYPKNPCDANQCYFHGTPEGLFHEDFCMELPETFLKKRQSAPATNPQLGSQCFMFNTTNLGTWNATDVFPSSLQTATDVSCDAARAAVRTCFGQPGQPSPPYPSFSCSTPTPKPTPPPPT